MQINPCQTRSCGIYTNPDSIIPPKEYRTGAGVTNYEPQLRILDLPCCTHATTILATGAECDGLRGRQESLKMK